MTNRSVKVRVPLILAFARVPRPASSPPPAWWRAFVCRSSGRPASPKHSSATAAIRSPFPFARRPRSRLGNPAWMCQSGGRHRFRQASSPPVQARCSAATFTVSSRPGVHPCPENAPIQMFLPIFRRQPAWLRSSPRRITPRRSLLSQSAKRSSHRTRSVERRSLPLRRHQL